MKYTFNINQVVKVIPLFILLLACTHRESKSNILQDISDFENPLIDHFPSQTIGLYTAAISKDNKNDVISAMLLNQYEHIQYNRVKDSLIRFAKAKYETLDSCLLIVNMYTNENNFYKSHKTDNLSYLQKDCLKEKLPIPNFWMLGINQTNIINLPDDFEIYVFKASHDTINEKYLSKNALMPSYWKHGYSKGIATNDSTKEVIYWFVIW